jgi:hypothetical protein
MSENADQFEDREDDELEPLAQADEAEANGEAEGERGPAQEDGD